MKPMVVTWNGGMKFTAEARGHRVVVDQPLQAGGEDTALMPVDLLTASLGTCVAFYVQQFLATRKIDATGMTVEITAKGASNPHRLGSFDVVVDVPAGVPERYLEPMKRAAESCTVHHTLTVPPSITVQVFEGRATQTA